MSWKVFSSPLFSARVWEGLVLFHFKHLTEFISTVIWEQAFCCGNTSNYVRPVQIFSLLLAQFWWFASFLESVSFRLSNLWLEVLHPPSTAGGSVLKKLFSGQLEFYAVCALYKGDQQKLWRDWGPLQSLLTCACPRPGTSLPQSWLKSQAGTAGLLPTFPNSWAARCQWAGRGDCLPPQVEWALQLCQRSCQNLCTNQGGRG